MTVEHLFYSLKTVVGKAYPILQPQTEFADLDWTEDLMAESFS